MKIDLSDKTILVTGANSGIGNAIAHELLDAGAQVALHFNSNSDGASKLKEQFSDQCELFQADFNNVDEAIKLFEDVLSWRNTLDILINNAGTAIMNSVNLDDETWIKNWNT
ncbi:uncharacterized protein METZ01_LOCUS490159, partial [marine metagenome]